MMNSMVSKNGVTFKEIKKEIFRNICEAGRELTKEILERYDQYLHETRNREEFRDFEDPCAGSIYHVQTEKRPLEVYSKVGV